MKVYGDLQRAQLEQLGALPAAGTRGRIVFLTTDSLYYVDDGAAWHAYVSLDQAQTLTNKTLTAPVINSPTGIVKADVGLGNVDNTSDATKNTAVATLTNKTLTAPAVNDGVFNVINATDQGSTPASPSAGTTKVYSKTDGKVYKLTSAGVEQELGAGAGGGSINYISANPDAETSTTGWATYKDAAQSTPVDGTGGSPTLTFTRTTSSPLRGTGSFLITTTAANLQGEGASYDFTLSSADQAKVMSISFDYNVASGTFVTGDLTVYIYDVTNALVIQPTGYQIQALGSTLPNKHIATFQTSSNSTSYRLIFHRAVSTASAMTMKIDNVQVGPQIVQYGAPVTDPVAYTPSNTQGFGTISALNLKWNRNGAFLELTGGFTAGTTTGSTAQLALPTGMTIGGTTSARMYVGELIRAGGTRVTVIAVEGRNYLTFGSGASSQGDVVGSSLVSSSEVLLFNAVSIPITGWSSTVQMSNDTDTRVVAAGAYRSSTGQTITAGTSTEVVYNTVRFDSHGTALSASTGRYTALVPGYYRVTYNNKVTTGGTAPSLVQNYILKNNTGSFFGTSIIGDFTTNKEYSFSGSAIVQLNAGDYVSVICAPIGQNVVIGETGGGNDQSAMYVERLSGPSAIAASERITARYIDNGGQVITANVTNITWSTRSWDTHGSWNGTTFTAQTAGYYDVKGMFRTTASLSQSSYFYINAVSSIRAGFDQAAGVLHPINGLVFLNAGDALTIRSDVGSTLLSDTTAHWLSVTKL